MAIQRDRPYAQFNFLVDLGTGNTEGPEAGFQECSGLDMRIDVIEYRNGNDRRNDVRKLTGLPHYGDVTLKRGIIGALDLYQWFNEIRNGQSELRNVLIHLQNEDHSETVLTWRLINARPIKYAGPALNAKGTDVAIEELTLAYERLEME